MYNTTADDSRYEGTTHLPLICSVDGTGGETERLRIWKNKRNKTKYSKTKENKNQEIQEIRGNLLIDDRSMIQYMGDNLFLERKMGEDFIEIMLPNGATL